MKGITFFEPKRAGAIPAFLDHTDAATRRSVGRLKELIEDFGEDVDAALLFKALTTHDLARIVAFFIESDTVKELKTINIENFEICENNDLQPCPN